MDPFADPAVMANMDTGATQMPVADPTAPWWAPVLTSSIGQWVDAHFAQPATFNDPVTGRPLALVNGQVYAGTQPAAAASASSGSLLLIGAVLLVVLMMPKK